MGGAPRQPRLKRGPCDPKLIGELGEAAKRVHEPHALIPRQRISSSFGEQTSTASAFARETATFSRLRENRKPIPRELADLRMHPPGLAEEGRRAARARVRR